MNFAEMTIKEIKEFLQNVAQPDREMLDRLQSDRRAGVRNLVAQWQKAREKRLQAERRHMQLWAEMSRLEHTYRRQGFRAIAGVDEAGRGPLAGPVVAAAVILGEDCYLPGLNDSKKLSPALREAYYDEIMQKAAAVGIGVADVELIDEINIYQATLQAMREAVKRLARQPDLLLNDAVTISELDIPQIPVVGGDGKSVSIAAASVVAKVTRDRLMAKYAEEFPEYGFDRHMGYATEEHLQALRRFGPCRIHRKSFGIVKDFTG
ncbi:ribonuclease HII [Bacillaceae bacterium]